MNERSTTPVTAKPSASVLLLRDSRTGPEIFVQHRTTTMDFASGAVVFPGGRTDPVDHDAPIAESEITANHTRLWQNTSAAQLGAGVILRTAQREVFEETGLQLNADQLYPWANIITPEDMHKRFDTFFFLAFLDDQAQPHHQTTEAVESRWWNISALIDAAISETVSMMLPTRNLLATIEIICRQHSAEAFPLAAVRHQAQTMPPIVAHLGATEAYWDKYLKNRPEQITNT